MELELHPFIKGELQGYLPSRDTMQGYLPSRDTMLGYLPSRDTSLETLVLPSPRDDDDDLEVLYLLTRATAYYGDYCTHYGHY